MSREKQNELPKSIDLSHHLSELAKARQVSPLKGFFKYYTPDILALAGGVPHPDYFPFATLEASTLPVDTYSSTPGVMTSPSPIAWLWNLFSSPSAARNNKISVPKYVSDPLNEVNLATALQYGMAIGVLPLQQFLKEYSSTFYRPGFSDFTTLVHTGNTDGWSRVVYSLLNPGDSILVEEWTYPSALSTALPIGVHSVSVPLDSKGMRPDALRHILSTWDSKARGFNRPRLLYTVPIGQNPSGLTTGEDRKRAIYDICVEYDIIIGEDDPYYILQEGEYVAPKVRAKQANAQKSTKKNTDEEDIRAFVDSLEPSYLRYDYQGRVIRLDTFSKTIAPGSRLGWFTCNPIFAERLERAGEVSTQAPSGFTQSMVTQLVVKTWGMAGYVRWLRGLRAEYTTRRDTLIDAFCKAMNVELVTEEYRDEKQAGDVWNGATVWTAVITANANGAAKSDKWMEKKVRVSFVPPTSGMFVWVKVDFSDLSPPIHVPGEDEMESTHEGRFWATLAKAGLLILPGWLFRGEKAHAPVDPNKYGHYRISFSDSTAEKMDKACQIFAKTLRDYCSQ